MSDQNESCRIFHEEVRRIKMRHLINAFLSILTKFAFSLLLISFGILVSYYQNYGNLLHENIDFDKAVLEFQKLQSEKHK